MNQETNAALDESTLPPASEDQTSAPVADEVNAESAPAAEQVADQDGKPDGLQKRINKITADKYAEKRRADELQARIDQFEASQPSPVDNSGMPTLEQFDFDEQKFMDAQIDYKVEQKAAQIVANGRAEQERLNQQQSQTRFNNKIAEFGATDYEDVVRALPNLPPHILDAIMESEDGPKLAYHLGMHLDVADELSQSTPSLGLMKLGVISSKLSAQPKQAQPSAAPDPIAPINGGGATSKSYDEMSMSELMDTDTG